MSARNLDAYDLIPADSGLPELYATEHEEDPTVHVKLFTPDSSLTWYLTEYSEVAPDGAERLAFGLATGLYEPELGYISLDELKAGRGPLGLRVERDVWWTPTPLSVVRMKEAS